MSFVPPERDIEAELKWAAGLSTLAYEIEAEAEAEEDTSQTTTTTLTTVTPTPPTRKKLGRPRGPETIPKIPKNPRLTPDERTWVLQACKHLAGTWGWSKVSVFWDAVKARVLMIHNHRIEHATLGRAVSELLKARRKEIALAANQIGTLQAPLRSEYQIACDEWQDVLDAHAQKEKDLKEGKAGKEGTKEQRISEWCEGSLLQQGARSAYTAKRQADISSDEVDEDDPTDIDETGSAAWERAAASTAARSSRKPQQKKMKYESDDAIIVILRQLVAKIPEPKAASNTNTSTGMSLNTITQAQLESYKTDIAIIKAEMRGFKLALESLGAAFGQFVENNSTR